MGSVTSFVGAKTASGQREYVTVLFSDLSDSTRLGGLMEAEKYSELLHAFRAMSYATIGALGGRIVRIQGDGFLAIFGHQQASETDGRNATTAALEIHQGISKLSTKFLPFESARLSLHTGIHAGLVLISEGDLERGRFELLGDAPNIAAKLCALATSDEILVSEETLGRDKHLFGNSEARLVSIKGRDLPLSVVSVTGLIGFVSTEENRSTKSENSLVGRDAELLEIHQNLKLAVSLGAARCVSICGNPGLGKTTLVRGFLSGLSNQSYLMFQGYCDSSRRAEPLQPFLHILRSILGLEPGVSNSEAYKTISSGLGKFNSLSGKFKMQLARAAAVAGKMPNAPNEDVDLISALIALFNGIESERVFIFVLEDWQWADTASQHLLDVLRVMQRPALIIVNTRETKSDTLGIRPDHSITLSPLKIEALKPIIERLLPGADPLVVAQICQLAGGVPLYVEELCHAANAGATEMPLEHRVGTGTAWLNALIDSRVDRLPSALAEVAKTAAVIGEVFPKWLLERVFPGANSENTLRLLEENDLIFAGEQAGTLRFKHGIAREVIYASVGLYQRRSIHINIADAIEGQGGLIGHEESCEALAYHYREGGLPAVSARFAEQAGDKAMRISALDLARHQYLAALNALEATGSMSEVAKLQWISIAQKLGMACVFDPLALSDGVAIFTQAVELASQTHSPNALARARYWLGYIYYAKGLARKAREQCERALDLALASDDTRLAAQVTATLGQVLLSAGEYKPALALFDNALGSKRSHIRPGSGVAVGSAYTLACKGYLLGDRGQFQLAHECFQEALELLGESKHQVASSVRHWFAVVLQWQGRWKESAKLADESSEVAIQVRSRQQLAMGKAIAGYSRWKLNGDACELQAVRDATSWIEARHGGLATSLNHGWLIDGAVTLNSPVEARRHGALLFKRTRHLDRIGEAMGCRALAQLSARQGELARSEYYLERAEQSAKARESVHERGSNQLCRAEIAMTNGNLDLALKALDFAKEVFFACNMEWHLTFSESLRHKLD